MTLEQIKQEIRNARTNAQKSKEAKEAEIVKLQERLAQILIGIDDALLNDNSEKITALTNEKREVEEKITLYNNFLKDFNKKPVLSEEKAQKLFDETLKIARAYNDTKKYESIKKLIEQLDKEANDLWDFMIDIQNISSALCSETGNSPNSRYSIGFEYKELLRGILNNTHYTLETLKRYSK